jgi:hypothetical protein
MPGIAINEDPDNDPDADQDDTGQDDTGHLDPDDKPDPADEPDQGEPEPDVIAPEVAIVPRTVDYDGSRLVTT